LAPSNFSLKNPVLVTHFYQAGRLLIKCTFLDISVSIILASVKNFEFNMSKEGCFGRLKTKVILFIKGVV
jgi:hypothetical protein